MLEIKDIWLDEEAVYIKTADGATAAEKFRDYPKLALASAAERLRYVAGRFGIRWPSLDEDLSYEGFFGKNKNSQ